jgi:hypothetical protein
MKISDTGEVKIIFTEEFLVIEKEKIDDSVLEVKLHPRTNTKPSLLEFSWKTSSFTSTQMTL